MFIIFNTLNQVNNYLKRHPEHNHIEGCGCCWSRYGTAFDGKNVVEYHISSYAGGITSSATVIGRLKKR